MKWIQSIKQTGNLLLDGGLFICDSHFDENCFENDLREKLHFLKNIPKFLNTGQKWYPQNHPVRNNGPLKIFLKIVFFQNEKFLNAEYTTTLK